MATKRYAVLDAAGVVVNHILLDDPVPPGYWPGYGKYLLPLETVSTSRGGAGLEILRFRIGSVIPQIGDKVNTSTGRVTKFVPPTAIDPDSGQTVNLAPQVSYRTDVEPAANAVVTDRSGTTIT